MWTSQYLRRIDFRIIPILLGLMVISLLVIASSTGAWIDGGEEFLLTPLIKTQIRWFVLGWLVFLLFAGMDYHKLRQCSWLLYGAVIVLLIGLYFTAPIQNVQRWYRVPIIGGTFQPSEYAKLSVVIALSWFLEYKGARIKQALSTSQAIFIVIVPFLLILKQPDLGTALVLYPTALVMLYFAGVKRRVIAIMSGLAIAGIVFVSLMFLGILSHEEMRPVITTVLKDYQYERLNPNTYHQQAAQTAIALGGLTGSGWGKSEFTGGQWLPAAPTDSVFAAFAEEFGVVGVFLLLLFFFGLIYFSFQVAAVAKDAFGRFLSAGIGAYLAMHVLVSISMMCGFLPITGVPLVLVTYGGSSVLSTMVALGIIQSIYSRRFTF